MKRRMILYFTAIMLVLMALISCHTETPVNIDNEDPSVELLMVYNDTDTLYNSDDTLTVFSDFQLSLLEGNYFFKISTADNQDIYDISLIAEDRISGLSYEIKSVSAPQQGESIISTTYKDFPLVQEDNPQEFYLSVKVSDESENTVQSGKYGFKVVKVFPFNLFFDALGLVKEVEGDSVDFREKNNKLAFVQFISKGCLSCYEEAEIMKEMYLDPTYDLDLYSHSLIGNYTYTEAEFKSFKTRDYKLPYDCFYDNPGNIKVFFEGLVGKEIENEVFAVLPNGKIIEYDYTEGEYIDWIHGMYALAYPNN